jgi:hypothetical protein
MAELETEILLIVLMPFRAFDDSDEDLIIWVKIPLLRCLNALPGIR